MEIIDQKERQRYLSIIDGQETLIDYKLRGNRIYLVHTEVPKALSGQGIAARLVKYALNDIRKRGLEMVAICPYVQAYLRRYPHWNDLITIIEYERH